MNALIDLLDGTSVMSRCKELPATRWRSWWSVQPSFPIQKRVFEVWVKSRISSKCIATSNKGITTSNKKLVVAMHLPWWAVFTSSFLCPWSGRYCPNGNLNDLIVRKGRPGLSEAITRKLLAEAPLGAFKPNSETRKPNSDVLQPTYWRWPPT